MSSLTLKNSLTAEAVQAKLAKQNSNWNYTVEQVRLTTPNGEPTRFFGNRRVDTGEVLGVVSEKYNLLQNADLLEQTNRLLAQFGGAGKVSHTVENGGARVHAQYILPQIGFKIGGQEIIFRLGIQNSFDGSLRVAFNVGMFRLICSNGATAPIRGGSINLDVKHTGALNLEFAGNALNGAVDAFHRQRNMLEAMDATQISQATGHRILNGLILKKAISEHQADSVRKIWDAPTHREDEGRNVYNLWNATTQHLTHEVQGKRFSMADRYSKDVTALLGTHALSRNIEALALDLPVKKSRIIDLN